MRPNTIEYRGQVSPCCSEENLEYDHGDGVEFETYNCTKCDTAYVVDIEIVRDFKNMSQIKEDE